jgi:hypothetical protein
MHVPGAECLECPGNPEKRRLREMSESETKPEPKTEEVIVTCEGCCSKWRLKFSPAKTVVVDLVECPLCAEAEKHE